MTFDCNWLVKAIPKESARFLSALMRTMMTLSACEAKTVRSYFTLLYI